VSATNGEAQILQPKDERGFAQSTYIGTLRAILVLHALAVLTQAVLAGQFLSGIDRPVVIHEAIGWAIVSLSILQVTFAFLVTKMQRNSLWFVIVNFTVFLGESLQVVTGYGRFLGVHIPLGVIIFGTLVWQLDFVFRKRALSGDLPR
jgi:hypothetical protein